MEDFDDNDLYSITPRSNTLTPSNDIANPPAPPKYATTGGSALDALIDHDAGDWGVRRGLSAADHAAATKEESPVAVEFCAKMVREAEEIMEAEKIKKAEKAEKIADTDCLKTVFSSATRLRVGSITTDLPNAQHFHAPL